MFQTDIKKNNNKKTTLFVELNKKNQPIVLNCTTQSQIIFVIVKQLKKKHYMHSCIYAYMTIDFYPEKIIPPKPHALCES